ncbi:hypothetical protein PQR75_46565 [Paraburkholderia fungorum]|uniref:hypothetical protein n=1 Tax=Paraburkholderia fungorum TaxID=134537 RepID=UPI0038BD8673
MDIIRSFGTMAFILVVGIALVAVADVLFGKVSGRRGSHRKPGARATSRAPEDAPGRHARNAANRSGHG